MSGKRSEGGGGVEMSRPPWKITSRNVAVMILPPWLTHRQTDRQTGTQTENFRAAAL